MQFKPARKSDGDGANLAKILDHLLDLLERIVIEKACLIEKTGVAGPGLFRRRRREVALRAVGIILLPLYQHYLTLTPRLPDDYPTRYFSDQKPILPGSLPQRHAVSLALPSYERSP